MADDVEIINIVLANLHNYILVIYAAMEEATNQTHHAKSERPALKANSFQSRQSTSCVLFQPAYVMCSLSLRESFKQ